MSANLRAVSYLLVACGVLLTACERQEPALPKLPPMHAGKGFTAADVSGCYSVEASAWTPPLNQSAPLLPRKTNLRFERPRTNQIERLVSLPLTYVATDAAGEFPYSTWSIEGDSTIRVTWSRAWQGKGGVTARLSVDRASRSLRGEATRAGAASEPDSVATVRMVRVPC